MEDIPTTSAYRSGTALFTSEHKKQYDTEQRQKMYRTRRQSLLRRAARRGRGTTYKQRWYTKKKKAFRKKKNWKRFKRKVHAACVEEKKQFDRDIENAPSYLLNTNGAVALTDFMGTIWSQITAGAGSAQKIGRSFKIRYFIITYTISWDDTNYSNQPFRFLCFKSKAGGIVNTVVTVSDSVETIWRASDDYYLTKHKAPGVKWLWDFQVAFPARPETEAADNEILDPTSKRIYVIRKSIRIMKEVDTNRVDTTLLNICSYYPYILRPTQNCIKGTGPTIQQQIRLTFTE